MSGPCLYLAASLDVEEEGLFGGAYARRGATVTNTAALSRLDPLCRRGLRPTLFCAWSVLTDAASQERLARLQKDWGVELGAHLHHWNTPPFSLETQALNDTLPLPDVLSRVPAAAVPLPLMEAKLRTLLAAGSSVCAGPMTSFRMGRWDAHRSLWPLLARLGLRVDASVRPLHCGLTSPDGPDHFDAHLEPYRISTDWGTLLEVPLTVTPLLPGLPSFLHHLPGRVGKRLRSGFRHWGVLALLPVYHPLWLMQRVTERYVARGGRVLSLTWHSSEMFPGATPHVATPSSVERLLDKITQWYTWLCRTFTVRSVTMEELRLALEPTAPLAFGTGDWTATDMPQRIL